MNPIRAGIAQKPEDAKFMSVFERIRDRLSQDANLPHSGWLAPVHVEGDGYAGASARRRASDLGYLDLTFERYLELLDGVVRREAAERAGGAFDVGRSASHATMLSALLPDHRTRLYYRAWWSF